MKKAIPSVGSSSILERIFLGGMVTVKFANPMIGDMYTVLLGCLSGIAFPVGFAYITNRLGAFGGIVNKVLGNLEFYFERACFKS